MLLLRSDIMKYVKKHKFTIFVIVIFIVAVIGSFFAFDLFFSNSGKPEYGNRLDGIENAEVTSENISKIKEELKNNDKVKETNVNISGRTLNIIITVDDNLDLSDAKKIGESSYSNLKENQIQFYSIQIFISKKDEEKNNFPIIGYKQRGTTKLVWTKDRSVTKKDA